MHTVSESNKTLVLTKALSVILPTTEQTDLLRACLHPGASGRQAWQRWQEQVGGLETALNNGTPGVKSLMPLLQVSGVVEDSTHRTYVRSAYLREKLRSTTYLSLCRKVLSMLARDNVPVLVLKGAALAETIYEEPALRHCHDIDLLVGHDDMKRATGRLLSLGWTRPNTEIGIATDSLWFEHESGLPLELHNRLFRIPYYCAPLDEIWARSQIQPIADISSQILSPPDNLLHVCGHASCCKSRESLRWVSDGWFLIHRHPHLDWELLLDCALQSHLALPLSVTLGYLAKELRAPIPNTVLDRLRAAARQTGPTGRAAALLGAQTSSSGTFANIMRTVNGWHERARILNWLLFPPPIYFRWLYGARHAWQLPFFYLRRPFWYVARRISRLTKVVRSVREGRAQFTFRG